ITEDSSLLSEFCRQGGWQMLNDWLNTACSETNVALQKLLLDVFLRLPVGVDMLQANNTAKVVKQIAKSADSELAPLAANVVERWLACIKAAAEQEAAAAVAATAPESGDDISEDAASSTSRQKKKKDKKEKKKKSKKEKPDREAESVRQQSVPSTVRTAPATFRDTNLLALDELVSEDQQQPAGSKRKQQKQLSGELASSAASASSGKPAKRARLEQQNDLESIHSSIEVRPTSSLEADPIAVPPSKPSPTSPSSAAVAKPAGVSTDGSQFLMDSLFGVCRSSLPKIVRKKRAPSAVSDGSAASAPVKAEKPEAAAEPIGAKQAQSKKQKDKQSEQAQEQQTQKQQQQSKRKRVTWAHFDALEQVFYFELDPSERRSAISSAPQLPGGADASGSSVEEMARREHERECELLTRARRGGASGSDDFGADVAKAIVWYKPHRIHGMPEYTASYRSGAKSTERAKQAKRQETMLQVIYFSLDTTPASATEPDVEHFDAEEPIIIPLENATSASAAPTSSGGEAAAETSDPSDAAAATEAAASALSTGAPISATITTASSAAIVAATSAISAATSSSNGPAVATSAVPTESASHQLLAVGDISGGGGGISLKPEIADILKQVTSSISAASPGLSSSVPPQQQPPPLPQQQPPQPASSSDSAPASSSSGSSVKEMLWNLLKSHYPDLHAQSEDLTVERIRQLLEPLRGELAASGMFPQVLRSLFPSGPPSQPPIQPPPSAANPQYFEQPPPPPPAAGGPPFGFPGHHHHHHHQPHPFRGAGRGRGGGPSSSSGSSFAQSHPPPHVQLPHHPRFQHPPRGVCRMWFHGGRNRGACTRGASC
uniref:TFIIS N-terminal domain-containing protein n=1 Tax=Macrostomum lignano TaxID=282301 RepID=A0A1I8GKY5_9PLAT